MFHATVSISSNGFALGQAFTEVPRMEIEAERIAGHSREWVMPCLWAAGGDFDSFDTALQNDPSVDEIVTAEPFGEEKFYQLEWADPVKQHVDAIVDREGTILKADARNGDWRLRIRFATQNQFDDLKEYLVDAGISFELLDISQTWTPRQEIGGLTAPQRNALVAAVEKGYYHIPRETTVEEIARTLGISPQATSERLRRGTDQLVRNILITTDEHQEGSPSHT